MVIVVCARYAGLVVKVSSLENTDASSSCVKTWTIPVTLNVIIHYFVANILVERHATGVNLIVVCSDLNTELILLTVHQTPDHQFVCHVCNETYKSKSA